MLNRYLFQKLKLIGNGKFNHLINNLTFILQLPPSYLSIAELELNGRHFPLYQYDC